jgi:hypothetical protein
MFLFDSLHERRSIRSDRSNKGQINIREAENSVPEERGITFHLSYPVYYRQIGAVFLIGEDIILNRKKILHYPFVPFSIIAI